MGNTVEIKLNRGFVAIVDEDDFERVNAYKWSKCKGKRGKTCYAITNINGKKVRLHRFILGMTDPKIEVDHKDANGMNNSKINLRPATRKQNAQNLPIRENSKTGYKGVCLRKGRTTYQAHIGINGKTKVLGCFNTKEDAARAYNEAALMNYGEFSNLNEIPCV